MNKALRTTGADLGAALAGIAVQVERHGAGFIATEPGTEHDEFTQTGHGATPGEAAADLRDALGLDDPEQRAIDTDAADWIEPGGWDEEDEQDCFTGIDDEPANDLAPLVGGA